MKVEQQTAIVAGAGGQMKDIMGGLDQLGAMGNPD